MFIKFKKSNTTFIQPFKSVQFDGNGDFKTMWINEILFNRIESEKSDKIMELIEICAKSNVYFLDLSELTN